MATNTRLDIIPSEGGSTRTVEGRTGEGAQNRTVTLQAVPDEGYRFTGWTITKLLPLFGELEGPFDDENLVCNSSTIPAIRGNITAYTDGRELFSDPDGRNSIQRGFYFIVGQNQYLTYTGPDSIGNITTCPQDIPTLPGDGGTGIDSGRGSGNGTGDNPETNPTDTPTITLD